MKNTTSIKVPKKYQPFIDEIYKDSEGYWCFAIDGYYFPEMGCQTAHENTQQELLKVIRTVTAEEPIEEKPQETIQEEKAETITKEKNISDELLEKDIIFPYEVKSFCQVYGIWNHRVDARTPFEAVEKATLKMKEKYREEIYEQHVRVLDGSLKRWIFNGDQELICESDAITNIVITQHQKEQILSALEIAKGKMFGNDHQLTVGQGIGLKEGIEFMIKLLNIDI